MRLGENVRFSVVIVSCNKYGSLKKVATAVRKDYPDCEMVLADDCSTDKTLTWANDSGLFEQIVTSPEDNGYCLNRTRNRGIDAANGLVIALLDADVLPQPGLFEGHRAALLYRPDVISIGFTDWYNRYGTKPISMDHRRKHLTFRGGNITGARWNDCYGGNIAFEKRTWLELGGFDEAYDGAWGCEDLDFAYRAHQKGTQFFVHKDAQARHLQHTRSKSLQGTDKLRNQRLFYRKHGIALSPEAAG